MKVILLQDVAKIGRKHTIVNVPDGYGLNQLIPKGLAKPATPDNLKLVERLQAERAGKESAVEARFFETKKALEEKAIVLKGKKNDNGHLFAAIKVDEIVKAAKEAGVDIDPAMIKLGAQIKTTGEHEIALKHQGHEAKFVIKIE